MYTGTDKKNLISPEAADRLIAAHDGDVALLYLHAVRNGGLSAERAAKDLCRTLREIQAAEEKLRRMGILEPGAAPETEEKLPPEEKLPEYTARDIVTRTAEDPAFSAVLQEAARVFGHALSGTDLKRLFGIYDYLAMPAEVIYLLLHHCSENSRGKRLSMRYVEQEAYTWVNREVYTYEQAEEYIARCRRRREAEGAAAELLGISRRSLTASEKKYIGAWLDMGMDSGALTEAFDRTVLKTGKLSWSYMNTILQSWHDNGIHTLAEAEQRDPRRKSAGAAKPKPPENTRIDINELKDRLSKI